VRIVPFCFPWQSITILTALLLLVSRHSVCSSAPANDEFANRIFVAGIIVTTNGTTVGAGKQSDEPAYFLDSNSSYPTHQPVWWKWTATANGSVSVSANMAEHRPMLAVFTGTSLSTLTQVSTLSFSGPALKQGTHFYSCQGRFTARLGTEYAIAVDILGADMLVWDASPGSPPSGYVVLRRDVTDSDYITTFHLGNVTTNLLTGQPENATNIFTVRAYSSIGIQSESSNEVPYVTPRPPLKGGDFELTVSPSPVIDISTPSPGANLGLETNLSFEVVVISGDATIRQVEYSLRSQDGGSDAVHWVVTNSPFAFTWSNAVPGRYSLTAIATDDLGATSVGPPVPFTVGSPINDTFAQAVELAGFPAGDLGSTVAASKELGEPDTLGGAPSQRTLWWGWTAPVSGPVVAVATAWGAYPSVGVFAGSSVGHLREVSTPTREDFSFIDGGFYYTTQARFDAYAGAHYSIAVDAKDQEFSLAITAPPPIKITAPFIGQDFATGVSIPLLSSAHALDTAVSLVEYRYTSDTGRSGVIGMARTPPFAVTWSNVPPGRYSLTAKAFDEIGGQSVSGAVPITVGRPANDQFTNRTFLAASPIVSISSNVAASSEPGEPLLKSSLGPSATVWWSWTAQTNGLFAAIASMPCASPLVGVFTGTVVSNLLDITGLRRWSSSDSNGIPTSTMEAQFKAVAGRQYSIGVGAADACSGTIQLTVTACPRVSFTAPATNSDFAPGTNITLRVAASDVDGSIDQIQYSFASDVYGAQILGSVTTAPFSLVWSNVNAGRFTLTATAFDNRGASATSSPIVVVVGRATNDAFSSRRTLSGLPVTATGSNVAASRESADPPLIGGYSSLFRTVWWTWTAPADGSNAVVVTMPSYYPIVGVFTGTTLSNLVEVSTNAFDDPDYRDGREYDRSEARFKAEAGKTYSIAVGTVYGPGAPFDIALTSLPSISITNPSDAAEFTPGDPIDLQALVNDADGTVRTVNYFWRSNGLDRVFLGSVSNAPFGFTWTNPLPGRYVLTARAIDDLGASTISSPVTITVGRPVNDDFSNRVSLAGLPARTNGLTVAASKEPGEPSALLGAISSRTVWYSWTAVTNSSTAIVVTSPARNPAVGVFTGSTLSNLTPVSTTVVINSNYHDLYGAFCSEVLFNPTGGISYAIAVDASDQPFTLVITAPPTVTVTSPIARSAFSPAANISLQVAANDSDGFPSRVEYFADTTFFEHLLVGIVTNTPFTLTWSNVPVGAYVVSAKVVDNTGAFSISTPVPVSIGGPGNDNFANRTVLTGSPVSAMGSNAAATPEPGEPSYPNGSTSQTAWWSWVAPTSGSNLLRVTMQSNQPLVSVFSGTSVSNLTLITRGIPVTLTDPMLPFATEAAFNATAGRTYAFAVDLQYGSGGPFQISVNGLPRVLIVSPTDRAELPAGSDLALQVDTSDRDGHIAKVVYTEGYYGPNSIVGVTTNPPFNLDWSILAPGAYTLRATATDDSGASVTSDPVTFTVGRPLNDDFANRTPLLGPSFRTTAANTSATRQPGEPRHSSQDGHHSLWWTWTAPHTANYILSTEGSSFQTLLGVYVGSSVSNLTKVAADGGSGVNSTSWLRFDATAGLAYQIAVDGLADQAGEIVLSMARTPVAPNDNFADRTLISGSAATLSANSIYATSEPDELSHFNAGDQSVWWTWTAQASGTATFDTYGSTFDTVLAVYEGSSLTNLTLLLNDDDGSGNMASRVSFPAVVNTTYQIVVDGYRDKGGLVSLSFSFAPLPLRIGAWSRDSGGVLLQLSGDNGQRIIVEASTDLKAWIPISTNIIAAGSVIFADLTGTNFTHRFYRAALDLSAGPLVMEHPEFDAGQFELQVAGGEGTQVIIESSTDLLGWLPTSTNRITSGNLIFSDPGSLHSDRKFYRAVRR
jgi:hypothetical protein